MWHASKGSKIGRHDNDDDGSGDAEDGGEDDSEDGGEKDGNCLWVSS